MLSGKWDKPEHGPVDVIVHYFSHATSNVSGQTRPVAIVQEVQTGKMRYVDLTYITIDKEQGR